MTDSLCRKRKLAESIIPCDCYHFRMDYLLLPKCIKILTVLCIFICCLYTVDAGVGFEGACSIDDDCAVNDTLCWNGTCLCYPGLTYDPGSGNCTLGCSVYGTTYQEYTGGFINFSEDCFLDIALNMTLEECLNICNIRERCLHVVYGYEDEFGFYFCVVSQCSPINDPGQWDSDPGYNLSSYVRNCAGNNVIAECPAGEEYSLTSSGCADCPLHTYKPSDMLHGLCILCPYGLKANESAAVDVDQCYDAFFNCDTVADCPVPNMECVNNSSCRCVSGYVFDYVYLQCKLPACTESGFRRIPALVFDACIFYVEEVDFETCRDFCQNTTLCTGFMYDSLFPECYLLDCVDYMDPGETISLIDTYVKVCQSNNVGCCETKKSCYETTKSQLPNDLGINSFVCYPNGTMVYSNPNTDLFVDAMAIQNEGTSAAIKCTVSVAGPLIIIDGCDTDLEVNVFLSNRSISDFGDTFGGRASVSYEIRCDQITLAGVLRPINDNLFATLEVTTQDPVTPAFIVTSALRIGSASGSTTSTGVVGGTLYWTIDIPAEYNGRPTCTAYSGSSNSGSPNIQVVLDGCTQDSSLIADDFDNEISPDALTKRLLTQLYVFKFYNSEDVYFECTVKVCPSSSSSCDISCGGKKRELREIRSGDEMYFTTGDHLHLPGLSGGDRLSSVPGRICLLLVIVVVNTVVNW